MNRQELEKIVRPLGWVEYEEGKAFKANLFVYYNLEIRKEGELYLLYKIYEGQLGLVYSQAMSLQIAKDLAWELYLSTISDMLKLDRPTGK